MTLLLALGGATSFTALGAGLGLLVGHHHGGQSARRAFEQREDQRWGEIGQLNDLYEQPAYGDD